MKAEFINPFVTAGMEVLETVINSRPEPGQLAVRSATFTTQQVSIVIGVTGAVAGQVLCGMSLVTATKIAAAMASAPAMTFDEMASSAIAELGNMISGNATTRLSEAGYECQITPPTLVRGTEVEVSTSTPALVVPLYTDFGKIEINVALEECEEEAAAEPPDGGAAGEATAASEDEAAAEAAEPAAAEAEEEAKEPVAAEAEEETKEPVAADA